MDFLLYFLTTCPVFYKRTWNLDLDKMVILKHQSAIFLVCHLSKQSHIVRLTPSSLIHVASRVSLDTVPKRLFAPEQSQYVCQKINSWVYFQTLYCVPLNSLFIPMLLSHYLNCHCFVVSFEISNCGLLNFVLVFQDCCTIHFNLKYVFHLLNTRKYMKGTRLECSAKREIHVKKN